MLQVEAMRLEQLIYIQLNSPKVTVMSFMLEQLLLEHGDQIIKEIIGFILQKICTFQEFMRLK
mgnify:CR=1 FL=1